MPEPPISSIMEEMAITKPQLMIFAKERCMPITIPLLSGETKKRAGARASATSTPVMKNYTPSIIYGITKTPSLAKERILKSPSSASQEA